MRSGHRRKAPAAVHTPQTVCTCRMKTGAEKAQRTSLLSRHSSWVSLPLHFTHALREVDIHTRERVHTYTGCVRTRASTCGDYIYRERGACRRVYRTRSRPHPPLAPGPEALRLAPDDVESSEVSHTQSRPNQVREDTCTS